MATIWDMIMENLTTGKLQRMEFTYPHKDKEYYIKAYWVHKIIRIDIAEKKEEE